jgi:mannosyltransferase OCH1-like enzyme
MRVKKTIKKIIIVLVLFACLYYVTNVRHGHQLREIILPKKKPSDTHIRERTLRFAPKLKKNPSKINNTIIPRFIHQTWKTANISDADVPEHVAESVKAWSNYDSFTYLLWDDQDIDDFVLVEYPDLYFLYTLLTPVMRTDLFRLLVLYKYGGIVCSFYSHNSIQTLIRFHGVIQIYGRKICKLVLIWETDGSRQRNQSP